MKNKTSINLLLDIGAVIIALAGCVFLFAISNTKERIILCVLMLIILGYIAINIYILPKKLVIINTKKEEEKRAEAEDFLSKEKKELTNISNLYDYLNMLQEKLTYVYCNPQRYGFNNEIRFIDKHFSYIKIAIQMKDFFGISTTPRILINEEEIEKIMLDYNEYEIILTPTDIKMTTQTSKDKAKEAKEFSEEEIEKILKKKQLI